MDKAFTTMGNYCTVRTYDMYGECYQVLVEDCDDYITLPDYEDCL